MKRQRLLVLFAALYAFLIASQTQADEDYCEQPPAKTVRAIPKVQKFLGSMPDDVLIKANINGPQPRVGQIRYGSSDSVQVALLVVPDTHAADQFELYVDIDRDRVIRDDEKVDGSGRTREFVLDASIVKGTEIVSLPRKVRFRKSIEPDRFSIATLGGYKNRCNIDSNKVSTWRVDGNGNGLFSDLEDEVWIDANSDGRWSPISERHLYRAIVALNGKRFAVRGNETGSQLDFESVSGEGDFQLDALFASNVTIESFNAQIRGNDGSCYPISQNRKITLPVGKYTIGPFKICVSQPNSNPWSYSFSHTGSPSKQRWHEISDETLTKTNVFEEIELVLDAPEEFVPGQVLSLQPKLTIRGSYYLTHCSRGSFNDWGMPESMRGSLIVYDGSGLRVGAKSSGFA